MLLGIVRQFERVNAECPPRRVNSIRNAEWKCRNAEKSKGRNTSGCRKHTNAQIGYDLLTMPDQPNRQPGFETLCMHFAEEREANLGAAAPPLYQCSTFTYPNCAAYLNRNPPADGRFDYTRTANPTTAILERKIAELERGE